MAKLNKAQRAKKKLLRKEKRSLKVFATAKEYSGGIEGFSPQFSEYFKNLYGNKGDTKA
jgi:hypothetical protein